MNISLLYKKENTPTNCRGAVEKVDCDGGHHQMQDIQIVIK